MIFTITMLVPLTGKFTVQPRAIASGSLNASVDDTAAYYDHRSFEINFKGQPAHAAGAISRRHHNLIVDAACVDRLPDVTQLPDVMDAIQGDECNAPRAKSKIKLTAGRALRPLYSDDEIEDAFNAREIALEATDGVDRGSIVGTGPRHERV